MAARQVQLREALKTQIQAILDLPTDAIVESRRVPRVNADDLEELHLVFFLMDLQSEIVARGLDQHEFTIGLAIQKKVPGDAVAPVDDLAEFVETVKSLWEPGGELREEVLANFTFKGLVQSELYDTQHLLKYGVFTAILEITYTTEIEE